MSAGDDEEFSQHQNVAHDRNDSMRPDGAIAGRPWEHQHTEHRLQPVGPDQAGNAKNQVQLRNDAENQIVHGTHPAGESHCIKNVLIVEKEVTNVTRRKRLEFNPPRPEPPESAFPLAIHLLP